MILRGIKLMKLKALKFIYIYEATDEDVNQIITKEIEI